MEERFIKIKEKIDELAKLIKGKMAITIYANETWKQVGGYPSLTYHEEEKLMKNCKSELISEILLLRRKLEKFAQG